MDSNNGRPVQSPINGGGGDWRSQLLPKSRRTTTNKILDTLKIHLPISGQKRLQELEQIAIRFEERIYRSATSQSDYLRETVSMLLTLESKSVHNAVHSISAGMSRNLQDSASQNMRSQVQNQTQSATLQMVSGKSQAHQQLLAQNTQNNIVCAGVKTTASLSNSKGDTMDHGVSSNMFTKSQRKMQGRQCTKQAGSLQQHQDSQQPMYPEHLLRKKLQPTNNQQPITQTSLQQQPPQQNLVQGSQRPIMQKSSNVHNMLASMICGLQQNQQSSIQLPSQSVLNLHQQSAPRQQQQPQQIPSIQKKQAHVPHQSMMMSQALHQQPLMTQQPNSGNMQQNQLIVQQSNISDLLQQQQQPLIGWLNNLQNMPSKQQNPVPDAEPAISLLSNPASIGKHQSSAPAASQSLTIGTPGIFPSPMLECAGPDATHGTSAAVASENSCLMEQPIDRLLKAVKSISPKALYASVCDIASVVSMIDCIGGSIPGNGCGATVGEDLVATTNCCLQARNFLTQSESTRTKRLHRYTSAMPLNIAETAGSMNDNFKQLAVTEISDLESTATSCVKKARTEVYQALVEETRRINEHWIDTVLDVSEEDSDPYVAAFASRGREGTIVKCSFNAVSLSPNLKSHFTSFQMLPIQPLRLLVPVNYPNCSPILLDKLPVDVSNNYDDLSAKVRSSFSIRLRSLSQPMSLKEIASTWDDCARAVLCEYAQQNGGGTFSSKYGTWKNC